MAPCWSVKRSAVDIHECGWHATHVPPTEFIPLASGALLTRKTFAFDPEYWFELVCYSLEIQVCRNGKFVICVLSFCVPNTTFSLHSKFALLVQKVKLN